MKNKIGKVKETGSAFLKQLLGRNDRVKIIFFNQEIIEDADFSNNITELITSLGTAVPFGSTALYDAVAYGLNLMRGIVGRNIIIIFSDGEDNSSVVDPYTLSKKAERSNVKVYCIGTSNVMQEAAFNDIKYQELLEKIASASGGMTFFISGIGEIERVYSQIRQDIRSEYILQFSPEKRLNRYRPITVKLKKHRGYQIRTIKGYYY